MGLCHLLHPLVPGWIADEQYAFVPGRGISTAFPLLERAALTIAGSHKYASLMFVDLEAAYPSLRRSWTLACIRASGCSPELFRLFRALLKPGRCTIKWKGCAYPAY
eukprot:6476649-Amphidinium_carterae.1